MWPKNNYFGRPALIEVVAAIFPLQTCFKCYVLNKRLFKNILKGWGGEHKRRRRLIVKHYGMNILMATTFYMCDLCVPPTGE